MIPGSSASVTALIGANGSVPRPLANNCAGESVNEGVGAGAGVLDDCVSATGAGGGFCCAHAYAPVPSRSADAVAAMEDMPGMMKRYGGLTIPLGMLFAKGDRILDYRRQGVAMKQQCPTLDLVLLDGHGHMLALTAPDVTADLIRRVAARQLAARAAIA